MMPGSRALVVSVVGALLIGLATPAPGQGPRAAGETDGAHRGYLAARIFDGRLEIVDGLNPHRFFVPASVLKVVTVAAALEHLGPSYRWSTRVSSVGGISETVLDGDLIIEPGADPTWSADLVDDLAEPPLTVLAQQVGARGLTRVTGDLVVDLGAFPGRRHPVDRTYGDLPYRVGTPPAALAVDDATITIRVAPGASVGTPAGVQAPPDLEVINLTSTVGPERRGAGTLDFVPVWGTNTLVLRGEYPRNEGPFVVQASDPVPEHRAARRFREALVEAGVTIEGTIRLAGNGSVASTGRTVLAEVYSEPLPVVLEAVLTESRNWVADMLALTLAHEVAGTGRFDDGVEVIADFVERLFEDEGEQRPRLWIQDGSGLSPANLVTPATIVRVLAYALTQPWGRTLLGALARPGVRTLAAWPPLPPLAAKTGTLRHTVALAGVLEPVDETPLVFCYFVNHHPEQRSRARQEIAAAVTGWRQLAAAR